MHMLSFKNRARRYPEWIWAIKSVSCEINEGDVIGIVGRNGAGKSTLLKILAGITEPTEGYAEINGRISSLLEVGTGFHPELTGRDNIFLNGTILGMNRSEISKKFDEIVAFAEVEKFIDTPVKHYSSGMQMRLAFSVAAHLNTEIMLVDEVLAVGDAAFQKKCMGKIGDAASRNRTILFVSHNMAAVRQLCNKGILLSKGHVSQEGDIDTVVEQYLRTATEDAVEEIVFPARQGHRASFTRLCLRNAAGEKLTRFSSAETITVEVEYHAHEVLTDDHFFVFLERGDGLRLLKTADDDYAEGVLQAQGQRSPGRYLRQFVFPGGILNEGVYRFRFVLGKRRVPLDDRNGSFFEIEDQRDYRQSCMGKRDGVLLMPLPWTESRS